MMVNCAHLITAGLKITFTINIRLRDTRELIPLLFHSLDLLIEKY